MQVQDGGKQAMILRHRLQHAERRGIDIDAHQLAMPLHQDSHRMAGSIGQPIFGEVRSRHGRDRRRHLRVGRGSSGDGQTIIGPVEPTLDLRAPQIERAGQRQPDHEGDAEQAGIEMPAPHRIVPARARRMDAHSFHPACTKTLRCGKGWKRKYLSLFTLSTPSARCIWSLTFRSARRSTTKYL